ncbi:MAG: stage IV sporulation protein A [Clostridia bacterium]|nr:stage IV sporulation protein A [Clostridia bacterium]
MINTNIYADIARRTSGDVYIGVVGPVRTGKSTFIKKFMEKLVIPNITDEVKAERATDELPQSSAGRTIMTTEPKFIPNEAVEVNFAGNTSARVRMVDCVGFIVPGALGYTEEDSPRMVTTPWFDEQIPFEEAAEIGTKKVISDHSTIGIMVTTDGTIGELPYEEYRDAEERVAAELKALDKPFIILLNSAFPNDPDTVSLRQQLERKYCVPVLLMNILELQDDQIKEIIEKVLLEFPVKEIAVSIPRWVNSLPSDHWLRTSVYSDIKSNMLAVRKVREVAGAVEALARNEHISQAEVISIDLGTGSGTIDLKLQEQLIFRVISESSGVEITDESALVGLVMETSRLKAEYSKFEDALREVESTGYGIVTPAISDMQLEPPEIVKQGGKYGIRLKASAPSIHMMKANVRTEVAPIVGSEKQSEELVNYLLSEYESDPEKIWDSDIFGKSLHELVNEGLNNKIYRMPADARFKIQETLQRVINDGCNGLICIIL